MCPSCQTDLTLFELAGGPQNPADVPVQDGRSIDEILASIMDGKDDHTEIFETLKNVARETPDSGGMLAAAKPSPFPGTARELGEQFLCPVCETLVAADATVCPGCGAEFSEGESLEYECPVCKESVPAEADRCPNCGVRFAEGEPESEVQRFAESKPAFRKTPGLPSPSEPAVAARPSLPPPARTTRTPLLNRIEHLRQTRRESERKIPLGDRKLLYRELPKLVNEVKPLLVSAKRIGLEIDDGKRIINDAIQAGKGRDIERAVSLIANARRSLDISFVDFVGGRIESFIQEINAAKGDAGVQAATPNLVEAVGRLEAGDYDGAWDLYQTSLRRFETDAKDFHDARRTIDEGEKLLQEVRTIGMDTQGLERLLRQAREQLDRRDIVAALRVARQAKDRLNREVPGFVQEEMRKARSELLDLKLKGNDLAKPIGILKEASAFVKQESWVDALRLIRAFHKEIARVG